MDSPTGTGRLFSNYQSTQGSSTPLEQDCTTSSVEHLRAAVEKRLQEKNQKGWRRVVLNFTPSWFSVTMGTGIVSILLFNLPYNARWIYWLSVVIYCLNIVLFIIFTTISTLRYTMFEGIWNAMLRHPVQSMFLGTFPMGLATIVNMTAFVCVPLWGHSFVILTWTLWWIDVVISVATCMSAPFVIMHLHASQSISTMTAIWLLPIVATIVASASGGIVASILPNPQHALITLITSYILWGTGVPLAMVTLVIYFHRLTMHKLPPREVIVSVFLPLGPLGQGSFAIMQLGKVAMEFMPKTGSLVPGAGKTLYVMGFWLALIMWGYGCVWLFFALASISRSKFPFNMGWWGFTFPLGVFAVSTTTIAQELPSLFFRVLGTIFSLCVFCLWLLCSARTICASVSGSLFFAPCVAEYERERVRRKLERLEAKGKSDSEAGVGGGEKV